MKAIMMNGAKEWYEKVRRGASINQAVKEMRTMKDSLVADMAQYNHDDGRHVFIKNKTMDCFEMIMKDYRRFFMEYYGYPVTCVYMDGILTDVGTPALLLSVSSDHMKQTKGLSKGDIFEQVIDKTEYVKDMYSKWLYHYTPIALYNGAVNIFVYDTDIKKIGK